MGKSHLQKDDDWGYPYDSGNPKIYPLAMLMVIFSMNFAKKWGLTAFSARPKRLGILRRFYRQGQGSG